MSRFEELLHHFIQECHDDEVGLWYIVTNVRRELGLTEAADVRRRTMQFVRQMLESGQVQAGYYDAPRPFKSWSLTNDRVIARISEEWDQLGRDPNIGDIVVFIGKEDDAGAQSGRGQPDG